MNYEIKFDKGIPVPRHRTNWALFEVGDSVFFAGAKHSELHGIRVFGQRQDPPWRFVMRSIVENDVAGIRVWRSE